MAKQEDPALWGSLRRRNKQEKAQILLLKSWIWVGEEILIDLSATSILGLMSCKSRQAIVYYKYYFSVSHAGVDVHVDVYSISHFTALLSHGLVPRVIG